MKRAVVLGLIMAAVAALCLCACAPQTQGKMNSLCESGEQCLCACAPQTQGKMNSLCESGEQCLCACAPQTQGAVCRFGDGAQADPYADALAVLLPDYDVRKSDTSALAELRGGNAACTYDVSAVPALEAGLAEYWYPQFLATVVIAVRRDMTDAAVSGWNDLANIGDKVGFAYGVHSRHLMLAAVSYGLEGADFTTARALTLLRAIAADGRLETELERAPVLICYDWQAAAFAAAGERIEIIIPSEGTLSYEGGVVSRFPVVFPDDAARALRGAGLRTSDGLTECGVYPPAAEYARAARVSDFARFTRQTERTTRDFRHIVMRTRLYSSADQIQHELAVAVFSALATVWLGAALFRLQDRGVRRLMLAAALLTVGWMLLRLVKYQILAESPATRMCWYGYYFFQLSLPFVVLLLALSLDGGTRNATAAKALRLSAAAVQLAMMCAVFTNDCHFLVFEMDLSAPGWSRAYTYGPLYPAVFAASVLPVLLALGIMLIKARSCPKRAAVLYPTGLCALLLLYVIMYVLGVPAARESDYAMTVCTLTLLFFAAALRSGLIPVNTGYRRLFTVSPLKMQIVDERGAPLLSSSASEPLSADLWRRIVEARGCAVSTDGDTLVFSAPVAGGFAVWQEDVSPVNALHSQTADNVRRLNATNALLAKERESRRAAASARQKLLLTTALEREMTGYTDKLSRLIAQRGADGQPGTARIALLMCLIKRRCSLFFRETEDMTFPSDELAVYFDELAGFAKYAGVEVVSAADACVPLSIRHGTLLYDFFYAALDACAEQGAKVVLRLTRRDGATALMLLASRFPDGEFLDDGLRSAIEAQGGEIVVKQTGDGVGLSLLFKGGGAANG